MSFSYDAGSSTPGYAGLAEIVGVLRINSSPISGGMPDGGTYKTAKLPFEDGPPVRLTLNPYPADNGGTIGPPLLDEWQFSLTGWLYVPSGPDDVPAAEKMLRESFAMSKGVQTLQVNMRGWPAPRQYGVQTNGPITFAPHTQSGRLVVPARDFTIPMVAPDPIGYDITQQTEDIPMTGVNTGVTSNGSEQVPFTARFVGPFTDATLTRVADGTTIEILGSFTAGQYVDVSTFGPITAVRDDGSNQFGQINSRTATRIRPGTENWKASAVSGTTGASKVTFTWRDGWA